MRPCYNSSPLFEATRVRIVGRVSGAVTTGSAQESHPFYRLLPPARRSADEWRLYLVQMIGRIDPQRKI